MQFAIFVIQHSYSQNSVRKYGRHSNIITEGYNTHNLFLLLSKMPNISYTNYYKIYECRYA